MSYINFNDITIPIGKRKQAYVKWAISKGTSEIQAKKQANAKFGFEQKEGLLIIVNDYGRMGQHSFCESEIFDGFDLRKYKNHKWIEVYEEDGRQKIINKAKEKGWEVRILDLVC